MISDIFSMSLDALRSRKIRTFLTLMGVIIGTGSVIVVAIAGNSMKMYVKEQWNIFDPTGMIIGSGVDGNPPQLSLRDIVFTDRDVENIQKLPHVGDVAPVGIVALKRISLREGFLQWESRLGGTMYASNEAMLKVLGLQIEQGRLFEEKKNEIVISKSYLEIFGSEKRIDIGDTIYLQRIDGRILKATIVGIMAESTSANILSSLTAPSIIGPTDPYYSTAPGANVGGFFKRVTGYSLMYATATSVESVEAAQEEILQYLNSGGSDAGKYKSDQSDFVLITQEYILLRIDEILNVINMFITAIAIISLVVGGIGIANIMYATVTERTREIGTMMALGAKSHMILQLFLYQAAVIGLIGGVMGCILGAVGGALIIEVLTSYIQQLGVTAFGGSLPLLYPMEWFVIALVSGLAVGIFAGVLPARQASRLDPVIALRYE